MKITKILAPLFLATGIILLLVAYWQFNETKKFMETSAIAPGTVTDLVLQSDSSSRSSAGVYYPVIRFKTATGETIDFKSTTGSNPPAYKKGAQVQVRYDPNNPYRAKIDSFFSIWIFCILSTGMGIAFSGIGLFMFIIMIHSAKRDAWLQQYGQIINAEFQSVEIDNSTVIRGRSPYRIVAHWRDPLTNRLYIFKSKEIWSDPTAFIQGKDILVRIDPQNPKKYAMDISFIPEIEK
jgi:hypothetical protein